MNKLQKMAGIGALVAALSGCENKELELEKSEPTQPKPELFVYGTIVKERGTAAEMMEPNVFSGVPSIRSVDLIYVVQIQTDDGLYTAKIVKNDNYADSAHSLEVLALAIKEGTRIKIPTWAFNNGFGYRDDKIGCLYSNQIFLDEKQDKKE